MNGNDVRLKVARFNPDTDSGPEFQSYIVPCNGGSISLLTALRYIYDNLDGTLAFRNYDCYLGVCACCLMTLDGKNVRACSTLLSPGQEATVEPLKGHPVIRDLVTKFR